MKKMNLILFLLATVALSGCGKSDPYNGRDDLETKPAAPVEEAPPTQTGTTPVPAKPDPLKNLGLESPDFLFFKEGVSSEFTIKGLGYNNTQIVLSFVGLPTGMTYDANTQKLMWTPSFSDGNDVVTITNTFNKYVLQIYVHAVGDTVNMLSKDLLVIVENVPRRMDFSSISDIEVKVDTLVTQTIEFQDEDFLAGPFQVYLQNFPQGATLEFPDPTKSSFNIKYQVPTAAMTTTAEYQSIVNVYNPMGRLLRKSIQVKLKK